MVKNQTSTSDTDFEHDKVVLTQNNVNSLNSSLSKLEKKILLTLYRSPHMAQKVLAANLQTTPASLGNIISRMKDIVPQLLVSERTGRTVFYSLSTLAELYTKQELSDNAPHNPDPFIIHLSDDSLTNDTLRLLSQFQSTAGSNWEIILDNLLLENSHDHVVENQGKNTLYSIYTNFIDNMIKLRMQNKISSIQKIDGVLHNSILKKRMEQYLERTLEAYFDLAPLFDLEKKQSLKEISYFVDYIFQQINRDILEQDNLKYNMDFPVTKEQYHIILSRIQIMIREFSNKFHGNRQKAFESWEKLFFVTDDNVSLYFIAYNCSIIYVEGSKQQTFMR